ncbi:MAG: HNH endonuclease [Candidatus Margulisbacteria bacterium]|nr:HNH endonuclease [Candidatus Margulisiibacteriota bacterium]MBU1616316.1 HNH endonuclease [Candidatus Margulisiibacteriota bacterium]
MGEKVLVLNASLMPINITSWRRAMSLIYKGKAVGVVYNGKVINGRFRLPEVIRLTNYIFVPFTDVVFSRKNIYLRDNHTCQYCGKKHVTLTIDHVVPKSRGGRDAWDNVVVCCSVCNNRKGDRHYEEVGMKLKTKPYRPSSTLYLQMTRLSNSPASWFSYFFREPEPIRNLAAG